MEGYSWNMWSILMSALLVVLAVDQCFSDTRPDRSKISELRCFTCVGPTCENMDWKKSEPKNCTADVLREDNIGSDLLYNLTYIPYSPIHEQIPEFVCQKIETDSYVPSEMKKVVVRRCALRLPENRTCDIFYENLDKYGRNLYRNSNCSTCYDDGCNSGAFNYIWIPLLFASIIPCLLLK